jgi:hypothetical protein
MLKFPQLKYRASTLDQSVGSIHGFLNPYKNEWDWSDIIYKSYPDLEPLIKAIKKVSDRKQIEEDYFKKFVTDNRINLKDIAGIFQASWDKNGKEIFEILAEIVEIDWAEIPSEIVASVSLNPINPRFIKSSTFDIFYGSSSERAKSTTIHEIFHFIYFKKWREIFPKTKEREFDAPCLVWHLSEMIPGIVLNDDRLQEVFKHKFHSYDVYEGAVIDGKLLLSSLQNFYDERKDFDDFLKNSWDFAQRNQKIIQTL